MAAPSRESMFGVQLFVVNGDNSAAIEIQNQNLLIKNWWKICYMELVEPVMNQIELVYPK